MLKAVLIKQMRERGAPALRVPDPYGVNRWILSAKRLIVLSSRPAVFRLGAAGQAFPTDSSRLSLSASNASSR